LAQRGHLELLRPNVLIRASKRRASALDAHNSAFLRVTKDLEHELRVGGLPRSNTASQFRDGWPDLQRRAMRRKPDTQGCLAWRDT
jgi:hypothetical protein